MKIRSNATRIWKRVCGIPYLSEALQYCLDAVFPPRCAVCDSVMLPGTGGACAACERRLPDLSGPLCMKCGRPLPKAHRTDEYCADCENREHIFDRVFPVFPYDSAAASLYRFKYMGRREYAAYYARRFVRRYRGLPRGIRVDALVPVPLHAARLRKRGYNQAEAIASALSKHLDIPVRNDLVARVKATKPQKNLDYYGRLNNLKNAFIVVENDVECNSVALVDDIFTTGSTADEIAFLLKRNGVREVYVFTPAIATKLFS